MNEGLKRTALLLGTYHMGNPGRDMYNVQADDVLAPERQRQIREVTDRLARFRPTKIAVEALADTDDTLHEQYRSYLAGQFELPANEQYQLGFRTAAQFGLNKIDAVDWNEWFGGVSLGDVYDYAQTEAPELYKQFSSSGEEGVARFQNAMAQKTIRELLLGSNNEENWRRDHESYMTIARVGDGKRNIGIDWLCNYWYRRNMIIYANMARITTPGDRILVIYGSGHMHLLAQFMRESGLFAFERADTYLA
ncbi:DUF5694 domain-containing protein [Paenibacillus ginsengarvi]|uniref:Haem-binding uptake Tiki superfamily ChaN domain-containing protein n=1 Tax=Paenibacillus ginsengarvi TaxID=400777 RepID=A0A3B0AN26_9BACL|nr:DUF5694 domain-containing protein [Paenibacillus ginsengarvi]RKN60787.1 hypothetical protein D7M11_35775 [Paenibacillus ginsengarvi]